MVLLWRIGVRVLVSLSADVLLEDAGTHESGYKTWNIIGDSEDNIAPEVTLVSSDVRSTLFKLTAIGHDNEGVAKYKFYLYNENNEELFVKEIASTDGSVSWNVTSSEIGKEITAVTTYKAKVIVYDKAGNSKTSDEIEIITIEFVDGKLALVAEVGDFVDYDAGTWNSSTDASKITSSGGSVTWSNSLPTTQGQFGGFVDGGDRNKNSTPYYADWTPDYEGWRVWSIEGDVVTLISAGHPETYYHKAGGQSEATLNILRNRDCSMYLNGHSYATNAWILTGEEAVEWYNNHFDSDYRLINYGGSNYSSSTWYAQIFPETRPIDVLENGSTWWLATAYNDNYLYVVYTNNSYVGNSNYGGFAYRGACPSFSGLWSRSRTRCRSFERIQNLEDS